MQAQYDPPNSSVCDSNLWGLPEPAFGTGAAHAFLQKQGLDPLP